MHILNYFPSQIKLCSVFCSCKKVPRIEFCSCAPYALCLVPIKIHCTTPPPLSEPWYKKMYVITRSIKSYGNPWAMGGCLSFWHTLKFIWTWDCPFLRFSECTRKDGKEWRRMETDAVLWTQHRMETAWVAMTWKAQVPVIKPWFSCFEEPPSSSEAGPRTGGYWHCDIIWHMQWIGMSNWNSLILGLRGAVLGLF